MSDREPEIDWRGLLRTGHRLFTFGRALLRDPELASDTVREQTRATKLHETFDRTARTAVGCQKPAPCECPICTEEPSP